MALSQANRSAFKIMLSRAKPYTDEDYPKKAEEYDINHLLATVAKRALDNDAGKRT